MSNPAGSPIVLVVEDEPAIAELLQCAFEDAGFSVVVTGDGDQALGRIEAGKTSFVGLVTDVNLGRASRRDGWSVARRARELSPTIAVVYCSGDSGADWSAKGVPQSVMLTKPFAPGQVVVALSSLLNASTPRR